MKNKSKTLIVFLAILISGTISYFVLNQIPFNIDLQFGWNKSNCMYSKNSATDWQLFKCSPEGPRGGFPFSALSNYNHIRIFVDDGHGGAYDYQGFSTFNNIGYILNTIFLLIVVFIFYKISRVIKKMIHF